jgi:hypothetical protein
VALGTLAHDALERVHQVLKHFGLATQQVLQLGAHAAHVVNPDVLNILHANESSWHNETVSSTLRVTAVAVCRVIFFQ